MPLLLRFRMAIAFTWLVVAGAACTTWRSTQRSGSAVDAPQRANIVRVVRRDSTKIVLTQPVFDGQAVAGRLENTDRSLRIPLDSVARVEIRRFSPGRTGGLLYLVVGVLGVLAGG